MDTYEAIKADRMAALRDAVFHSPVAYVWFAMHSRGQIDLEEAMIGAIASLVKQNAQLVNEIATMKMREGPSAMFPGPLKYWGKDE